MRKPLYRHDALLPARPDSASRSRPGRADENAADMEQLKLLTEIVVGLDRVTRDLAPCAPASPPKGVKSVPVAKPRGKRKTKRKFATAKPWRHRRTR